MDVLAWSLIAVVGLLASLACVVPSFAQILGTAQLNVERRGHSATLLEDGKVLIVGGDNLNGMVSQAEIVDPVSQTSSLVAASITARTDHTATRLSDGRVLVIGGRDQSGSLTSSDIYNPLTATFTAGPSLTTPRSGHTATVLADGKILVAGGDAGGSAELYNPATENFSLIAGSMNAARKFHSAILTTSGQVLDRRRRQRAKHGAQYSGSVRSCFAVFLSPAHRHADPARLSDVKTAGGRQGADHRRRRRVVHGGLRSDQWDFYRQGAFAAQRQPAQRNAKHAEPRGAFFTVDLKIRCSKGC